MQCETINKLSIIVVVFLFWTSHYYFPSVVIAQETEKIPPINLNYSSSANHKYDKTHVVSNVCRNHKSFWSRTKTLKQHHGKEKLSDKKAIRDFLLFNYAHVADDIIKGSGIYLDTLYILLGIKESEKKICRNDFLCILLEQKRILDFSNCISNYDSDF